MKNKQYTVKDWKKEVEVQVGKKCPKGKDFDEWLQEGPTFKCVVCGKDVAERSHYIEDCLKRGEARNHVAEGETPLPWA